MARKSVLMVLSRFLKGRLTVYGLDHNFLNKLFVNFGLRFFLFVSWLLHSLMAGLPGYVIRHNWSSLMV